MIILFHCLIRLIYQLLRNRKRIKLLKQIEVNKMELGDSSEHVDIEYNLKFQPPLFRQRYRRVYETLLDERWRSQIKTLVDFGCSEFGLFVFIKRLTNLNVITFVDIDEDILQMHLKKLKPLTIEFLKRREQPLNVNVFAGSVADPDYRLSNIDAVTAVELIEHLYPDILDAFPYNVFGFIEPKIVIVTTPNVEFNVLFRNQKRFRHYDHKFEWTRGQFQEWATNITTRFPDYSVSFSGIGEGPEGTERFGQCTQMAVFTRKDLLDHNYVLKVYGEPCRCDANSPCKAQEPDIKFLCNCVCVLCSPSSSYGVCTYHSSSKQIASYENGQTMKNDDGQVVPYNIYYKFISKIEYPFEYDTRSEEEKMMEDFRYRINTMGQAWSMFYVEERHRSEIPLKDLTYIGHGTYITMAELHKLLYKHGYQIEECVIEETGAVEQCVIYTPLMGEVSSSSEASGYDSDIGKYQLNEEALSDWDEPYDKEDNKPIESYQVSEANLNCLEMTSREAPTDIEEEKKQQDALFDSGYQKSLSLLDDSPQTPLEDLEEIDLFEDTTSTLSLSSEDPKTHLKRGPAPDRTFNIPPCKLKFDANRINELDRYHNVVPLPPPLEANGKDKEPLPGPSSSQARKRKKFKKGSPTDTDEESPFAEVRSIASCILEDTLNRIEVKENELIEFWCAPVEVVAGVVPGVQPIDMVQEAVPVVENGDLANNNRDIEGNNYIAQDEVDDNVGNDIANDNLEIAEQPPLAVEENANIDNNNGRAEALGVIEDPPLLVAEPLDAENAVQAENAIDKASREVLVDENSEQDLLEDFEIPAPIHEADPTDEDDRDNVRLVGIHLATATENLETDQTTNDVFPDWLLQILGAQAVLEEVTPPGSQEGSHFYCQGDGLGVHPSVIAVEVDDEDETTESSNNTADYAGAEQDSSQDMTSLPEDTPASMFENDDEAGEENTRPTASDQDQFADDSNPGSDLGANQ